MTNFYKFSNFSNDKISTLQKSEVWFSSLQNLNDPFEGRVKIVNNKRTALEINDAIFEIVKFLITQALLSKDECRKIANELKREYSEGETEKYIALISHAFDKLVIPHLQTRAVCCFAVDESDNVLRNQLMWSHYADGMRGYCLEFHGEGLYNSLCRLNTSITGRSIVTYTDDFPEIDPVEYFYSHKEEFVNGFPIPKSKPIFKLAKILSTKSNAWQYEKENRIFSKETGAMKIAGSSIKAVVLGEKMPEEQGALLKKTIQLLNPKAKIKHAKIDPSSYAVVVT